MEKLKFVGICGMVSDAVGRTVPTRRKKLVRSVENFALHLDQSNMHEHSDLINFLKLSPFV